MERANQPPPPRRTANHHHRDAQRQRRTPPELGFCRISVGLCGGDGSSSDERRRRWRGRFISRQISPRFLWFCSSTNLNFVFDFQITEIKPLELRVKFGSGFNGRIHITEATDDNSADSPFSNYRVGQSLTARIVSKGNKTASSRGYNGWELSIKPSLLKGYTETSKSLSSEDINYSYGQCVSGFVYKIDPEWAWLTVSREFMAQLYILDSSCEPCELADFQKRFYVGKAISGFSSFSSLEIEGGGGHPSSPAATENREEGEEEDPV
ncbi:rRNA biogenesis protein RRP5-like [Salvia miltiorrhiza]|uniref:rRNA biogenesis protein RRP5-like n=1 Tax=Salvia miltiorrhiza TaxID=226208 RepID=UPI0025AB7EFE|nr:rRNA biogenesis protein RRP5-like [Salvia miltiorrhiza]